MKILPEYKSDMVKKNVEGEKNKKNEGSDLPILKEYAWDFETDTFVIEKGRHKVVEKDEALKIWIYKALKTPRYSYPAYSWDFGSELEEILRGGGNRRLLETELRRCVKECLLVNPYINSLEKIDIEMIGDKVRIDLQIESVYGEVSMNV